MATSDALGPAERHELVLDAWRMVVPKYVAADYLESVSGRPVPTGRPQNP